MTTFFGREARLVVARKGDKTGFDLSELDLAFDIRKNLKAKPNVGKITIWNMAPAPRKILETSDAVTVEIYAGYTGAMGLLYSGEMRAAVTAQDQGEYTTVIQTADKASTFAHAAIRTPMGPGSTVADAIKACAKALGDVTGTPVGTGAIDKALARLSGKANKVLFPHGGALSGRAASQMTALCAGAGLEWSVQDGAIQILGIGDPDDSTAVELGPSTGMVGNPSVSHKGYVKATSLLNPRLRCGRKIVFDNSNGLQGAYRIEEVRYEGDRAKQAWYAHIEAGVVT